MIRRPNSPYFKIDFAGRFVLNAYRTADRRQRGVDPIAQRVDERGRFDVTRGWFLRFGHVGIFAAVHSDGPARKPQLTPDDAEESEAEHG